MVHSLETITSFQDGDHQSITNRGLLEPYNSILDVVDVVARKVNQISPELKGTISKRLTQTL